MSQSTLGIESKALLAYLNSQRNHALGILEGLDEETLRRPILPSGWSCLGLIQHLAMDVEWFWFRCTIAGERDIIETLDNTANNWLVAADTPAAAIFDRYRQEIAHANEIIAAMPLDSAPIWWPREHFGDWRLNSVREIILHVLTETACHAGHLDAARELIDGRSWLVMD